MSLIADALKAAEKQKAQRLPPPRVQPEGYFALRMPARSPGEPFVSPLVIGIGVATAAIALVILVLVFSPSPKPETKPVIAAPLLDSIPSTLTLETPGDPAGFALTEPDLGSPIPPSGFDEFEDAPPVRAGAASSSRRARSQVSDMGAPGSTDESLPSLLTSSPTAAPADRSRRLEITVDKPMQSSAGGGLFEQGLAAQRRGDYTAAKNYYLQATYLAPRNPELFNNLGTVYRALRDLPAAEAAYRNATDVDRRFAPAWSNLGVVLGQQGRPREGITALQEAMRLDPVNPGIKVNLAIQLHATGQLAEARPLLEEAVRIDPGLAEAHYELGRVLEKQGERTAAIVQYGQFLSAAGGRFPELEQLVRSRLRSMTP